jgi:hypothetical protein
MKRFSFLATLLGFAGAARAQTAMTELLRDKAPGGTYKPWEAYRPNNNQCPVCGTMAPRYHPTIHKHDGYQPVPGVPYVVEEINGRDELVAGATQITRCARCNAAFWQDAV